MKSNKYISIESIQNGMRLIRKSRGELSLSQIMDALSDAGEEQLFAIFIKATVFDGWLGEGAVNSVELYDVEQFETCPVCQKALTEERGRIYEEGYKDGMSFAEIFAKAFPS